MCLLMARNLFVYNHYLVENMVKKIILLLVVILHLCGCNQKVQCTETSENDSIAEFFRKFYVGCNDYYAQRVVSVSAFIPCIIQKKAVTAD